MAVVEPNEQFLEGLYQAMRARAVDLAKQLAPDASGKELTPDEIHLLWNTRAMPLEQEWALWSQTNPDGTPTFTPEQIGLMVFPQREGLAKRGGRVEPREQTLWANQQAKRSAARRVAEPLPPDPTHDHLVSQQQQQMPIAPAEGDGYAG